MSKQSIAVVAVAVVAVILIIVFAFVRSPGGTVRLGENGEPVPTGPVTRESIPSNVVISVPGIDSQNVEEGVAIPEEVAPTAPHRGGASQRTFDVRIVGGKFEPEEIRAFLGDTVRINLTAVDAAYDYSQPDYGFRVSLQAGETKFTQFDATATGIFTIVCESCGGLEDPQRGPIGHLVVAPRE
ncbi:MAG: hypothetical protein AAB897_04165 [Patescibacteria group bacterium]